MPRYTSTAADQIEAVDEEPLVQDGHDSGRATLVAFSSGEGEATRVRDQLEHLRDIPELWPLRGRRAVVAVCRDDAVMWDEQRAAFAAEGAELVLEALPGSISARVGRPSVVVCDRWQEVVGRHPNAAPEEVLAVIRWLGTCCDECPQAMLEPGGERWREVPGF